MDAKNINKPLARWTIGNVKPDGFKCLAESIESFTAFYDTDIAVCYNCNKEYLPKLPDRTLLINQHEHLNSCIATPKGVAWKLYPPRLAIDKHEIVIDNDILFEKRITQIDEFFNSDCTLLLQERALSRNYGQFEKHVPPQHAINSGIYGMPPGFSLQKYIDFYVLDEWQKNVVHDHEQNYTFDEQGILTVALLDYPRFIIIPQDIVTNCGTLYIKGNAMHFCGLNRLNFHRPFAEYKLSKIKIYL